jgi:uncharacterized protein YhfF
MEAFMHHLMPAVTSWWADLGAPEVTPELQAKLVEGVKAATGAAPIPELAKRRDEFLTALIELRRKIG